MAAIRPLRLRLLVQVGDLDPVEVAAKDVPIRLFGTRTSVASLSLEGRVMRPFMRAVARAARRIERIRP